MKRRRPTADDRDLCDALAALKPGRYDMAVTDLSLSPKRYLGLPRLKVEGALSVFIGGAEIIITPAPT